MAEKMATTTDHDTIRRWVEGRGGVPTAVKNTLAGDRAGILNIDFPGLDNRDLSKMTWEEFFKIFDAERLAFEYADAPADGDAEPARDYRIVDSETGESVGA